MSAKGAAAAAWTKGHDRRNLHHKMQRHPWFARIGFALIPITLRGVLFMGLSLPTIILAGNVSNDYLGKGDHLRAIVWLSLAVVGAIAYVVTGLLRSRPFRQ